MSSMRFLSTSNTTDDRALALNIYSGVFAEAFRAMPKLFDSPYPVIHRKTVDGAKSYQALMMAQIQSPERAYTPGNRLLGQDYAVESATITADKYVLAHSKVPRDEMRVSHFEILPRLARSHARELRVELDRRLFITGCNAARAAALYKPPTTGLIVHNGGNRVTRTGGAIATSWAKSTTGAANIRADLRSLGRLMDDDNVPDDGRFLWVTPHVREVLAYDSNPSNLFSRDYIPEGTNVVQRRVIREIEGFKLIDYVNPTTNGGTIPDENMATYLDMPTKYQIDFSIGASNGTPVALALCDSGDGGAAISLGTWESIQHEVTYIEDELVWLVASFTLAGIGQMYPWCAGSIECIT